METNWATEHLQTIRTLMERSALYRRALAPVMTYVGFVGIVAALAAGYLRIKSDIQFEYFWLGVALVAIGGTLLLIRRQAIKQGEVFWSPPTRRIVQAIFPALLAGLITSMCIGDNVDVAIVWTVFYALALHAAGFFMPRGIRLFAWLLLVLGLVAGAIYELPTNRMFSGNQLMGFFFGFTHLAYGIYLYFTERKNEA
jgi:hypothetical protein